MKTLVPQLYGEYGRYINEFRAFPSVLDGCKLVERRLLYSVFEVAKDKKQKAAKVVGWALGNYHPHGDQSAYSTLVNLVQNKLVEGQGNWGNDVGIDPSPPAAQRYTECKAKKEILELAFEFIKFIPKEAVELDPEPLFLPTKLPFCLLGETTSQGIGFGYRTALPCYDKKDLIKRLSWLLGYTKTEPVIKPKMDCEILSGDKELKQLLKTGKIKLDVKGKYSTDYHGSSVIIESLPPGRTFQSFLKKFEKEIQVEKSIGFTDESVKTTKVRLKVLRQRGYPLQKLIQKVDSTITGSSTFECNMVNKNGKVVLVSIDKMLLNVYNMYKNVVMTVLKSNIKDLSANIKELNHIRQIKPVLSVELKKNPDDVELVIKNVASATKIPSSVVKELFEKYTIGRIFRIKTETQSLTVKKTQEETNLKNLESFIWKEKYS